MIRSTKLDAVSAARLLWAAAFMDAVFVFFLLELFRPALRAIIQLLLPALDRATKSVAPELTRLSDISLSVVFFILLFLAYWTVTEVLLGGRTIGRFCLRLHMQGPDGQLAGTARRTKRGLRKVATLGLSGRQIEGRDKHDIAQNIEWQSPLSREGRSMYDNWRLVVVSGRGQGEAYSLSRLEGFQKYKEICIGRDHNWADILLDRDGSVSSKHARIRSLKGQWQIKDCGSSNNTFLDGRKIRKLVWIPFSASQSISIAQVEIRLIDR